MSYTKSKLTQATGPNSSKTSGDIKSLYGGGSGGSDPFYQVELGEVIDIILDDTHSEFTNYRDIGAAKIRLVVSNFNEPDEECDFIRPLNVNNRDFPLVGELVLVHDLSNKLFYGKRLGLFNSPNQNSVPSIGLSSRASKTKGDSGTYQESQASGGGSETDEPFAYGNYFISNQKIHPLQKFGGDVTYEGRIGQSIRFGHNARVEGDDPNESPNLLLRVGQLVDAEKNGTDISSLDDNYLQPIEESINDDGSSIYLTTNQEVLLSEATAESPSNFASVDSPPEKYDGKQIILNSDRIIFNSKLNEIIGSSKKGISLMTEGQFTVDNDKTLILNTQDKVNINALSDIVAKTDTKFEVDSPAINLGAGASEAIPLGDTLIDLIGQICDGVKSLQFVNGAGPGGIVPGTDAQIASAKAQLTTALSKQNKTL